MSFIHSVELSELISTYDYMFGNQIVFFSIGGMSLDRCVIIFDSFPLSIAYIDLTVFSL